MPTARLWILATLGGLSLATNCRADSIMPLQSETALSNPKLAENRGAGLNDDNEQVRAIVLGHGQADSFSEADVIQIQMNGWVDLVGEQIRNQAP